MSRLQSYWALDVARAYAAWAAALLTVASFSACNRAANTYDATVQGAVTIDGELAPGGTVTFHPVVGGPPSSGRIHEDGSYSIRTGQGDLSDPEGGTIRSGEYVVTLTVTAASDPKSAVAEGGPPAVGARLMADKYATKESSDLKQTVKPGPNIINLKLDGPWANPPREEDAAEDNVGEDQGSEAGAEADFSNTGEAAQEDAPADAEPTDSSQATDAVQPEPISKAAEGDEAQPGEGQP